MQNRNYTIKSMVAGGISLILAALGCVILPAATGVAQQRPWIQLLPGGTLPDPRTDSSAVYSPATGLMVMFAGDDTGCVGQPMLNDTWTLTNANGVGGTPQWTNTIPEGAPGSPPVRRGHTAVYNPANDRMIVFGGDSTGCGSKYNDTWVLKNATGAGGTPVWEQLSVAGSLPPARSDHSAVYDVASNRMIIAGGDSPGTLNDVWVLSNADGLGGTPAWTELVPTGGPPTATAYRAVTYDPASNRMTVFGGWDNCCGPPYSNEVWVLTNANGLGGSPEWIQLFPTGPLPVPRVGSKGVYDAARNRMIVFGGDTTTQQVNQVWVLTFANGLGGTPQWLGAHPPGTAPAPRGGSVAEPTMTYDQINSRFTIFGGHSLNSGTLFNDTWVLPIR